MEYFIFGIVLALSIISSFFAVLQNMHMFQLNSYKEVTQLKWLKSNIGKLKSYIFIVILGLLVCFNQLFLYVLLGFVFIILIVINLPKKAKKPLVFTSRVKRMLFTVLVIYAVIVFLLFKAAAPYNYVIMCLCYFAAPFIVIISNIINSPVEKAVKRYYINDAKRLLKACPDLIVIGITGSYGKTSVKFFLSTLLKAKYNVLMTPESFNTPMGVVKTIRENLNATHEIFICEMGAKHINDIKELCEIVHPKYGIITSIGPQHLETFKTLDNIIKTKYELSDMLPADGMIFLNGDNEIIRNHLPERKYITYGANPDNNFSVSDIKVMHNGTYFTVSDFKGDSCSLQTQLIGEHNITNLAGAISLSMYLGLSFNDIKMQINKIQPVPHRLQLIETEALSIIDDAYNSNPNGSEAALKTLALFDLCKVLVTPGMIELGAEQDSYNYKFGMSAAKVCDYVVLVGEKQTRPIYKGLIDAGYNPDNLFIADGIKEAMNKVYTIKSNKRKIVLLENDLPDNY